MHGVAELAHVSWDSLLGTVALEPLTQTEMELYVKAAFKESSFSSDKAYKC